MSTPSLEPTWKRTTAAVLLVVLFFSAAVANYALWLQTTIRDTESFVATFDPLPDDVSVAQALGRSIANAAVDPEQLATNLADDLPEQLQPLAVPIATAVNQVAAGVATRVIESDPFQAVWERTLRVAHTALIDLLTLRSKVQVLVLDVEEAADQVVDRLEGLGIDVTAAEDPSITLVRTSQSPALFGVLRFVYSTGWVFPVVYILLIAGIVLLRADRRDATRRVALVTALAMVFDLVLARILRGTVSGFAADSVGQQALRSAWDTVTSRLRWQTWIVLLVALVVAAIAKYAGSGSEESYPTPAMADFLRRWGSLTQGAVVVLVLVAMLLVPSMTLGLALLLTALAVATVFLLAVGRQRAELMGPIDEAGVEEPSSV